MVCNYRLVKCLKCSQKHIIRLKMDELKYPSFLRQDVMSDCSVYLDRPELCYPGKQWSFTHSVHCRSSLMEMWCLCHFTSLLIHELRLAPFIAPFDVKSLKRIGGREKVTYKTWDFYRPMTSKAPVAHDPTDLYKRGETPPQFFTFYLEPSREIKTPFLLQVNFLQIPSSLCRLLYL